MIVLKAFFINLIFSGKYRHLGGNSVREARESTTYALFNGLMLTGMIGVIAFFIINITAQNVDTVVLYIDAILFFFLLIIFLITRTQINLWIPSSLAASFFTIFACYMLFSASSGNSSPIWTMLVPTVIIYLMPKKLSLIAFICTLSLASYVFFFTTTYEVALGARYFGVFVILFAFGKVISSWLDSLTARAVESSVLLEEETDELNAMRDNIDLGIFLLDKDYILQPLHSKHLSTIFEEETLAGASFLSLFRKTLLPNEVNILEDYLEMMFTTPDTSLLENINPLKQTKWQGKTGTKHLSISVSRIEKQGHPLLLGTVKDISIEIDLQKQIEEDEAKRQNEMKVVSEIMHASPETLGEFIADSEYEFGEINNILKAKGVSHLDTLKQVYQGVHAIKSNALIIGLQTIANKLHDIETGINEKIANGGLYEDILSLIFELENVMHDIDSINAIIKKMQQFSTDIIANDSRGVFIKSILNTIEKVNGSTDDGMHKLVELDVQQLEWEEISSDKKRDIKDIILQLIRNSCVHGIETAQERKRSNKDEKATIHLSIVKEGSHLIVQCGDDGKGIDYEKVLQKGKELNILSDSVTVNDKKTLMKLLTSPTFSTSGSVTQYAGRGVGLSLVVDKVKKYGGKVKIKSSKGVGTAFILTI